MARTTQQIIEDATKAYNPNRQATGMLTRQDLIDFIKQLPEDADRLFEITAFLEQLPFLTMSDKQKVLDDLPSYDL